MNYALVTYSENGNLLYFIQKHSRENQAIQKW